MMIHYFDNDLCVEDVAVAAIAAEVGTPAYVYSQTGFTGRLAKFDGAFKDAPHLTCYSVKGNDSLALLRLVAGQGLGADIVSGGELYKARKAGIDGRKIVFSGVGKTSAEMREALAAGIKMFNVESAAEMRLLAQVAAGMNAVAPVAIRLNPQIDPRTHPYMATGLKESKFGLSREAALPLYLEAAQNPHLAPIGLDCHIGSQLTDLSPVAEAVAFMKDTLLGLRQSGLDIRFLDMGGGLGVSYGGEDAPEPEDYAEAVLGALGDVPNLTLVFEPGRYVAAPNGLLLARVLYEKVTEAKRFIVTDAAMSDLIRPALYGAHHEIWPALFEGGEETPADVVGPVCESGDFLAKGRPLPPMKAGDLLAVLDAGAYGFTMGSNYNSRPRPAEVLVKGGSFTVVRRRQTYEDLTRGE